MLRHTSRAGELLLQCRRTASAANPLRTPQCLVVIGLATDAEVDELMRRAQHAGAEIVFESGNQTWGPVSVDDDLAEPRSPDAYAGAFADPDGHMWQVTRADGVLIR